MEHPPLTVYDWPASASRVQLDQGLLVIAVRTLRTMPRAEVRQQIRGALQEALAAQLACSSTKVELFSQPGQALRLLWPEQNIGLSISHEPGMSLAAININGKVGVDLMALNSIPPKNEMHTIATDYLGYQAAEYISYLPGELQNEAFAKAWTEFEARLKCQEEALVEWSPSRERRLATYTSRVLQTSEGYVGTVAFLDSISSDEAGYWKHEVYLE